MDLLLSLLDFDLISNWLGQVLQSEMMKMSIAFLLAARMHRSWVKKDMAEQFDKITGSINNVADKVSHGLALHSIRIDELSQRVETLESRHKN
jgi:hypothetical protein